MKYKLIFTIFVILLMLALIPFKFTASPEPFLFGWLPLTLAYWWILMFLNLIFVLWVAYSFVKSDDNDGEE